MNRITRFKCTYLPGKYEFIDCLRARNLPNGITIRVVTKSNNIALMGKTMRIRKSVLSHYVRNFELTTIG